MKTIQACTLIAIILLGFSVAGVSALTNTTFGGKSGDWIEYGFTQTVGQTSNSEPGEYVTMDFLSVEGANVTVNATVTSASSLTLWSETITIDLTSQDDVVIPQLFSARVYFIPAELNVNDSVYLGELFGTQNITGETSKSYAGADRTVIFTNLTLNDNNYFFYWDKRTGVLTDGLEYFGNATSVAAYSDVLASDTNMWSPPVIWPILVWCAIVLAIVLGALSSRRNASKKARGKSTKPTLTKTNSFLPFKQLKGKSY